MGKTIIIQKIIHLGKDKGPTSPEEVVHRFNFIKMRYREEVPLFMQEVLNGAKQVGETDDIIFFNYN